MESLVLFHKTCVSDPRKDKQVIYDILHQLHELHTAGYTHNDVRVPNIICGDDRYAYLIDYEYVISKDCLKNSESHFLFYQLKTLKTFEKCFPQSDTTQHQRNVARFTSNSHIFFAWLQLQDLLAFSECLLSGLGTLPVVTEIIDLAGLHDTYFVVFDKIINLIKN